MRGETATVTGTEIEYSGATETNWLNGTELLLKFETGTSGAYFKLPGAAKLRILAVGGGGGGGGVYSGGLSGTYGGGGGGGAGGFVEVTNVYAANIYGVTVGAGGAGGAVVTRHTGNKYGTSGGASTINTNAVPVIAAYGGGGGAGEALGRSVDADGNPAGSGGGGSQYRNNNSTVTPYSGGTGTDGQGYAGGAGNASLYGGGGGGAGGAGADANTSNPTGGVGRVSDIVGTNVWYAGGGGGSYIDKTATGEHDAIAGGRGGGGAGGYGTYAAAGDGEDCTGGGGGGANADTSSGGGGNGGSGVVYVRIMVATSGEIVKPDNITTNYDGTEHVLVPFHAAYYIDQIETNDVGVATTTRVDRVAAKDAGTYKALVTLVDGFEWPDGGTDPVEVTLTINKAQAEIENLSIRNWPEGTPDGETPNPGCDVMVGSTALAVTPTYTYSSDDVAYTSDKPTAAGVYWLKAEVADTDSYDGASAKVQFTIFKGYGDVFRDYVEFTIDGAAQETNDYIYVLKIKEADDPAAAADDAPYGFLHSRAGETGGDMAIADADGNVLPYKVESWDSSGVSTLYVKLSLGTGVQTNRLYWCLRDGQTAPDHSLDMGGYGEPEEATQPSYKFLPLVVRDGKRVNYFTSYPALTATRWDSYDTAGEVESVGVLAEGTAELLYVTNLNTGATYSGIASPTEGGTFGAVFGPHDPAGDYEPLEYRVDYSVIGHTTYDDLSGDVGDLTKNGRVLLANDDTTPGYGVSGQGYSQTSGETFWEHADAVSGNIGNDNKTTFPLLNESARKYSTHTLYWADGGTTNALWTLSHCFIGHLYATSATAPSTVKSASIGGNFCALPFSDNAAEAVSMVMQNTIGASVTSQMYTNGIGTVYFDAVNGCTLADYTGANNTYRLAVQTRESEAGNWTERALLVFKNNGANAFVSDTSQATNSAGEVVEATLDMTAGGGTDRFYRICVPVNKTGNVQFRILRTDENGSIGVNYNNFILLDNIIVSYPKSSATLAPFGALDETKTGRQTVGWGLAMRDPYPAVGEETYGSAEATIETNVNSKVAVDMPVVWAQMHYRWRYLDQKTNDWQTVELRPTEGCVSAAPLALPPYEGDVEFWYDYIVNVPAYKYHDYSGADLDLSDLYSEEVTYVTNSYHLATGNVKTLASGGTDWFFRLRRGTSGVETMAMEVGTTNAAGAIASVTTNMMMLSGSHLWRGFIATPSRSAESDVYVRVRALTWDADAKSYATNRYALAEDVSTVPALSGALAECAGTDDADWTWRRVALDGRSGQTLVQVQDDTLAYSVVHADWQDFNNWTDAVKPGGLFVGSSSDTNSAAMSGASASAATVRSDFGEWNETPATNGYWIETFPQSARASYTLYGGYSSGVSPNTGFRYYASQMVDGFYSDKSTGMALQMKGCGEGFIQLVDFNESPRGLGSLSFRARIAQRLETADFCYYIGETTKNISNCTFFASAAFDTNKKKDFSGNASLSLIAAYTPNAGGYEFRVEQYDSSRFSLRLYRWDYEGGRLVANALCDEVYQATGDGIFDTAAENGNYGGLFISIDPTTEIDKVTRVSAGMSLKTRSPNATDWNGWSAWRCLYCRDGDSKRRKTGTFGVASANCPAYFLQPCYSAKSQTFSVNVETNAANADATGKAPSLPTGSDLRTFSYSTLNDDGEWSVPRHRMSAKEVSAYSWPGFVAAAPSNTLEVYTAPAGSDSFTNLVGVAVVTNFGSTAFSATGSSTSDDLFTLPLYTLEEASVRIKTGGDVNVPQVDVTIDDIEFTQWRGESYDDANQSGVLPSTAYGAYTNIVFTQCWVTNDEASGRGCLMSAKRSRASTATSVRSPMMRASDGSGAGLGMVKFTYENAQTNAALLVQIATNGLALSTFGDLTKDADAAGASWTTVTNIDFSAMSDDERASGLVECYIGLHGVLGAMRIALDPAKVAAAEPCSDPTAFGDVTIRSVAFRDEPVLDAYSWWGWNMRTVGGASNPDDASRRNIADNNNFTNLVENGLSFALNDSIEEADLYLTNSTVAEYRKNYPFLQTPTFATNMINEISFQARLYDGDATDAAKSPARITLFGAQSGDMSDAKQWTALCWWDVTNETYATYTRRLGAVSKYKAFRLAVTGVDDVDSDCRMPVPSSEWATNTPRRVLIDEVLVMEGIVAVVGFANVGAFRTGLDSTEAATNVPSRAQQPLCKEEWGVQCDLYAAQLSDEIDMSSAKVRLWWYEGVSPWGFENWRSSSKARSAWLMPSSDAPLTFKSCYFGASAAVMPAQTSRKTVQYMLETIYKANGEEQTNWLSSAEWENPDWYAPKDNNAEYGGATGAFSAYTILDTVAPGWAWINEVNIFGVYTNSVNSDADKQFVEIAAPADADLSGWYLRMLYDDMSGGAIVSNKVATFGSYGISGTKTKNADVASGMVFHSIASPAAVSSLSAADGELDGIWTFTDSFTPVTAGVVTRYYPLAVQLVRPSGIVEHELVAIGTNRYATSGAKYDPEQVADHLNGTSKYASFFYAGQDSGAAASNSWKSSLGVFAGNGSSAVQWGNVQEMTPGRINGGQTMPSGVPTARGSALIVYSSVEGGHICQTFGDATNTEDLVTVVYRKGADAGTNITYTTDKWWEPGAVTVNGVAATPVATGNVREWTLEVGKATSNDVRVVASAQIDSTLRGKYGLDAGKPYTPAVMEWLARGTDAYGNAWKNPDADALGLAEYAAYGAADAHTNLTLTMMYVLDIDPTYADGDIRVTGGFSACPALKELTTSSGVLYTNVVMAVYMQISNKVEETAWPPYILQGSDFLANSWAYAAGNWRWTNMTFKIKGVLAGAGSSWSGIGDGSFAPLRQFVFGPASFDAATYTSTIGVRDALSLSNLWPGWKKWIEENPGQTPSMFYKWDIDDSMLPQAVKVLEAEDYQR